MKTKGEKIAFIVAMILIVLFITGLVFGIRVFIKHVKFIKDELSIKEFTSIMKENDFYVVDVTEQFENSDIKVKEARVAKKGNYQIEFFTFDELSDAELFYRVNKAKFEEDNYSSRASLQGKNYESYALTKNNKYQFIIKVDKSVVYVNVDKQYKSEVKEIVKKLGY